MATEGQVEVAIDSEHLEYRHGSLAARASQQKGACNSGSA